MKSYRIEWDGNDWLVYRGRRRVKRFDWLIQAELWVTREAR